MKQRSGISVHGLPGRRTRRGATAVETAITLSVFSLLVLGVMDVSMLIFQRHVVSHLAREIARQAIVHGEHAPAGWEGGPWGPTAYGPATLGTAPADDAIAQAAREKLVALDPARTKLTITWLDGDNRRESRVHVLITSEVHRLTGMFMSESTLRGESTMLISH